MEPVANTGAFDCTFLDEISEETILENLRLRFKIGKVKKNYHSSFSFSAHYTECWTRCRIEESFLCQYSKSNPYLKGVDLPVRISSIMGSGGIVGGTNFTILSATINSPPTVSL